MNKAQAHLNHVKKWVNSLKGLEVKQTRKLFKKMRPEEDTWRHGEVGGPRLAYKFHDYDIVLYCTKDGVVLVSIDICPE